jgi:hypothetical protein
MDNLNIGIKLSAKKILLSKENEKK